MKVVRLFRTLAFQPDGKDMERGPKARGTLAILRSKAGGLGARFVRDIDGDVMELEIDNFDVVSGVPSNQNVVLVLPGGKRHTFISYRELPAEAETRVTIVQTGINPTARTE